MLITVYYSFVTIWMLISFSGVLDIFAAGNILVWFCVLACADLIQPIDAGISHSLCIYVQYAFDKCLSLDENLELWEVSLGARHRRILMTNFLAEAMDDKMLSDENKHVRIISFERTGYFIELNHRRLVDGIFIHDKIKPQGLNDKYEVPANSQVGSNNHLHVNVPEEILTPETIDNHLIEEKDLLNDLVEGNCNFDSLIPEGIVELSREGDKDIE